MSQDPNQSVVEDDSALDAELEQNLNTLKAGKELEAETPKDPTVVSGEQGSSVEEPTGPTGATGETNGDSQSTATGATGDDEFKVPEKRTDESQSAYEKRVELAILVKQRKEATTPEAKEALSKKVDQTRKEYGRLDKMDRFTQPKPDNGNQDGEQDPTILADRERAKELGLATPDDVREVMRQERFAQDVQSTLNKFVDSRTELADPDTLEVFFQFVDENYVWQGKSGKDLETTLSLAADAMFKPAESITDRALKGAEIQKSVGAMQFPGGTGTTVEFSPDMRNSINQLKATGMSEEKAIELLSE